jgi:broad specificity phosphatase PhoE
MFFKKMDQDKLFIVMRHGERADLVDSENQILHEYDPELTQNGVEQALTIGSQLRDICLNKKILIVSSPFARTIMTSLNVIKGLDHNNINMIIDSGYSEFLSKTAYIKSPKEVLALYNNNMTFFQNLPEIDLKRTFDTFPDYPENIKQCLQRYINTAKSSINDFKYDYDVIITVTHGYGVSSICQHFDHDVWEIDYCYTFIFDLLEEGISFRKFLKPRFLN